MKTSYKLLIALGLGLGLIIGLLSTAWGARTSDDVLALLNNVIRPDSIENSFGLNMAPVVGVAVATSSDIGSLSTSTTYYFKVVAVGNNGTTSPSSEVNIIPNSASTTVVTWTAKTGASFYQVYIGTASQAENMYFATTGTSYKITTTTGSVSNVPTNDNTANSVLLSASSSSYFLGGNVGIGTSTPVNKLEVVGGISKFATTTATKLCVWNGVSYTILSFSNTSTSTNNFTTSTTCQ